jgi:hypothetical protein
MSQLGAETPQCPDGSGPLDTVIIPRARDIGAFEVRRALPAPRRRMVGPFIFWDQMGPAELPAGQGVDVRPHPHIGLATLTYLFQGAIDHRDSLGTFQTIRPGAVNLMIAGRGIVHSERSGPDMRRRGGPVYGIQSWIALPRAEEESAPAFDHHAAQDLPLIEGDGVRLRLVAGQAWGQRSPVPAIGDMLYADAVLDTGTRLDLPPEVEERAVYVLEGAITLAGERYEAGRMLVVHPGEPVEVRAEGPARVLVLGGATADGPRHIWWNFVHSDRDRIEQAKADWRARRFELVPGDEEDFIPLPES